MSLPFFSPAHPQAKKRDKGVSLTNRSLFASSYRSLPPAKRTFAACGSSKWSTGKRASKITYRYMV